jgi:hypothetical protein
LKHTSALAGFQAHGDERVVDNVYAIVGPRGNNCASFMISVSLMAELNLRIQPVDATLLLLT